MTYFFSEQSAKRVEDFFQTQLRYVEGEKAGQPFCLEPWQRKIVRDVFGWLREDGTRRYRIAYLEVPRKNGKSTFAAGLALYLLLCDREERPQVYSCAGDRDQAGIVFRAAREMVTAGTPSLQAEAELRQYEIRGRRRGGWYSATSAEAYSAHGKSPSGIIFDELLTQPNRELWDAMLSGRGARRQPLVMAITTAGHDRSSICWEVHQRAVAAMKDPDKDPTFYGVIYGAGDADDWKDEEVWKRANPNLGVSVSMEFLREECQAAINNAAQENVFRNLYLNQWTQQAIRWLPVDAWDKCQREYTLEDFAGEPCWAALDLASTRDINALTLLFRRDDAFYLINRYWMPSEAKSQPGRSETAQARRWADLGHITATEGNVTDYGVIVADILDVCERVDVQCLAYDPWGPGPNLVQQLQAGGFPHDRLREFRQNIGSFASPSKEFERRIANNTIHHNGDPVLRWMVGNVAAEIDKSGNIRPSKAKSADKIDGVVTSIMALGLAMLATGEAGSVYDTKGSLSL